MGTSASEIFDLRNLYYYKSGNSFTGSLNGFNYKIIPGSDHITAQFWHGMLCSDAAEIKQEKQFSFDEAGFDEMIKWLDVYKRQLINLCRTPFFDRVSETFSKRRQNHNYSQRYKKS